MEKGFKISIIGLGLVLATHLAFSADLTIITNDSPWGVYRTNINANTLQTNTNTWNIVTNAAGVAVNNTAVTNLTSEITVASGLVSINPDGGATDFVFGSTQLADTANATHDARMWFDKSKGAFRAGEVTGVQWNDASVGSKSAALGYNTTASGDYSVAAGSLTTASGDYGFALGLNTTASGSNSASFGNISESSGGSSFAAGYNTTASGANSMALGSDSTAAGTAGFAAGYNAAADSYACMAVGRYNVGGGTAGSWVSTDPLFELGMGTSGGSRSNAFTVYKNGNATLTGLLTLGGNPSADLHAMNKGYADSTYATPADITTASNGLTTAFIAADTVVSNGVTTAYVSADTSLSNSLSTLYIAADTTVSNGVTTAYIAADTVLSNALVGAISNPDNWNTVSNNAMNVVQPADSVTTLSDVSNAGSGLIITGGERTTLGTALQPADSVTDLSDVTDAGSGLIITDGERSAIGGGGTVPVSPYQMKLAYTFDGILTNDWWGTNTIASITNLVDSFDVTMGGIVSIQDATVSNYKTPSLTVGTNHSFFITFYPESGGSTFLEMFSRVDNSNLLRLYQANTGGDMTFKYNTFTDVASLSYDEWHSFGFSVGANGMVSYVDSVQLFTNATPLTFTTDLSCGVSAGSSQGGFKCGVLYGFDRTLSSNDFVRLHNLEINGQYGVQGLRKP